MKRYWLASMFINLCATIAAAAPAPSQPVSPDEALNWTRHLVPLPKKIEFLSKVRVPVNQVAISLRHDKEPLAAQAARELHECLGTPQRPAADASVHLILKIDPQEATLTNLPNRDQAYRILPTEGSSLLLLGGGPRGLYYAAKTMQQLIKPGLTDNLAAIPLVSITDWPDLQDRGLWGGDSSEHLRWMSDRKMNYDEQISTTGVDENK
ncbi:MAG: glycoside hydrolase family 20 zincin-like fold domain-containing protein [Phycisphaerae bacterium]